ncbi:MAG TPA: porin [Verrucomicrobiae bacterium]|jgi:phosphate-selective porin OprO/OprP
MKKQSLRTLIVILGVQLGAHPALADDQAELIKQLLKRVEELERTVEALQGNRDTGTKTNYAIAQQWMQELDQKVKVLERNRELDQEEKEAKAKEALKISVDERGFAVGSPDGSNLIKLRGLLQVDSRYFINDATGNANDSFILRRARPIFEGTVFRDFDFQFVPEFGGSTVQILEANLNYRYSPEAQLRIGKFKSPVGLEQLQSDPQAMFIERGLPTDLTPNRDLGVQLWGEVGEGVFNYAAGIFNGVGDNRNASNLDADDDKEFAGQIFVHPFKKADSFFQGLGLGVAGSYGSQRGVNSLPASTGGILPGFTTDGQQQFFAYNPTSNAVVVADGLHWRFSPQGYFYRGSFGVLGEYVISSQKVHRTVTAPLTTGQIDNKAWQVAVSYVLTGEDASYKGVTPRRPLGSGGCGALELTGRYAELDVDDDAFPLFSDPATSAASAHSFTVGLNWWLNKNIRATASFSRATFKGGGGAGTTPPTIVTRQPENVVQTRVQISF